MTLRQPTAALKRIVSVCRTADRHADFHEREFAETRSASVPDGELRSVVDAALAEVGFTAGARFVIHVNEPHEEKVMPLRHPDQTKGTNQ